MDQGNGCASFPDRMALVKAFILIAKAVEHPKHKIYFDGQSSEWHLVGALMSALNTVVTIKIGDGWIMVPADD